MKTRLNKKVVDQFLPPGKYPDRDGLVLRVLPSGSKQWIWRGTVRGKRRDRGLGGLPYVSLAEARSKAYDYRQLSQKGGDPGALSHGSVVPSVSLAEARSKAYDYRQLSQQGGDPGALSHGSVVPTFEEAIENVIKLQATHWKPTGRTEQNWRASLRTYAIPVIGHLRVSDVTGRDVMAVLEPIWNSKQGIAKQVRQRIGMVMKWAVALEYRHDNPAGEALGAALPKPDRKSKHRLALPHAEVSGALAKLRESGAYFPAILAFEFLTLCAVRSSEALLARWDEVDFGKKTWTIPKGRMKMKRAHCVPLSTQATEVLRAAERVSDTSGLVFPSRTGAPMDSDVLWNLCKRNEIPCVPHGMRSSFRTWAAECTKVAPDICELALAHVNSNRTRAAYKRTKNTEKRRVLMQTWADYISPPSTGFAGGPQLEGHAQTDHEAPTGATA